MDFQNSTEWKLKKRRCGIEIKLGASQIDAAAENLLRINSAIARAGGCAASQLLVIYGLGNAAYRRPDGVFAAPLAMLKP